MGQEKNHVIEALIAATTAPGAIHKLQELGMTADAAAQIIAHTAQIPAFQQKFNALTNVQLRPMQSDKLVFLHLPKCGGTTLHHMLVGWYGTDAVHMERHNGLYFYSARNLASKNLFSGHYDFYATQLVPGRPKLITFLREPRSRLISLYHFHRAHRPDLPENQRQGLIKWATTYDINDYFANPQVRNHPALNNSITRYLSNQPQQGPVSANVTEGDESIEDLCKQALANLHHFDFIGLMEDYDASITKLCRILGRAKPDTIGHALNFETLGDTHSSLRQIEKQPVTEETHRLMDELVAQDEIVYNAAKALNTAPKNIKDTSS